VKQWALLWAVNKKNLRQWWCDTCQALFSQEFGGGKNKREVGDNDYYEPKADFF